MGTCVDYLSTKDCFAYIIVAATDFPSNHNATLETEFADIDGCIAAIPARTRNTDALKLLDECRTELRAAHELYRAGKESEARKRVRHATESFVHAGRSTNGSFAVARSEQGLTGPVRLEPVTRERLAVDRRRTRSGLSSPWKADIRANAFTLGRIILDAVELNAAQTQCLGQFVQ